MGQTVLSDQADQLHREAADRWLNALRHTKTAEQNALILCQTSSAPDLYVRFFKIKFWLKVVFPLANWRLYRALSMSARNSSASDSALLSAEKTLGFFEFGDKIDSPLERMSVRKRILFHNLSTWSVRQAFFSLALKSDTSGLVIRPQPKWVFWSATTSFYLSAAVWLGLMLSLIYDIFIPKFSQYELAIICFLTQFLCIFGLACYRLGPQWNKGELVLRKLLSDRNH